jgi:glycine oxidase
VAPLGIDLPGEPLRGQIVHLELLAHPVRRIVWRGSRYLVPRPASPLLVGSTMERAGFDARPTAEGVESLLGFARETVPALAGAAFVRAAAGLRPGSADGLPYLGRAVGSGGLENLWIAAGHSRSGIELSAGSARALADLLAGASTEAGPEVDLSPFDPERTARLADRPRDHQPGGFS